MVTKYFFFRSQVHLDAFCDVLGFDINKHFVSFSQDTHETTMLCLQFASYQSAYRFIKIYKETYEASMKHYEPQKQLQILFSYDT